jgi:hypothetical protein
VIGDKGILTNLSEKEPDFQQIWGNNYSKDEEKRLGKIM